MNQINKSKVITHLNSNVLVVLVARQDVTGFSLGHEVHVYDVVSFEIEVLVLGEGGGLEERTQPSDELV